MKLLPLLVGGCVLLTACGAVVPATQSPKPLGLIVSSSSAPSATAVPSPAAAPSPSTAPSPSKPPFVPTPYTPPGPPNTLSNEQAQATRTTFEKQIADADQKLRTVSFTPQPTPAR